MKLYHFTCRDAAPLIEKCGHLLPYPQVQLDARKLIWFTNLNDPTRDQLGLTSHTLSCDRMEYRVTVEIDTDRWVDYVRTMPNPIRRWALNLGLTPGALPVHWWISAEPVPVLAVERV